MSDLFNQLGFVSAVLAGFAFTFVAGLLPLSSKSRAYPWVFGAALAAALSLMITAVGSVFASLAVRSEVVVDMARLHQLISQTFLVGVLGLLVAAGLSGWLRSRRLGIVSTVIAVLALWAAYGVIGPFLQAA